MGQSPTPSRVVALEVMRALRHADLLDRALDRLGSSLPPRDLAWTRELLYGTQRLRGRIDHLLEGRVRAGLEALQPDVLDVLRLGCYQLREMGSVPTYAAISQSVDLVRLAGAPRAAGLVNGVLRAVDRERGKTSFADPAADPAAHLVQWGSHPRWLVQRWLERYGADDAARLIAANNERPQLYIRPLGVDVAEAIERLRAMGIEAEPVPFAPASVRVGSGGEVGDILRAVPAVVQDPAAALVVDFAAIPEGATVLDLCAAPGGKTVGLAERAAFVAAADVSRGRIGRVRQNAERVGAAGRVGLVVADTRQAPFSPVEAVLLDAPCTGTGTFRRHPDGRWRVGPGELAELVALQRELLEAAAELVRPGGLLVYATCSLEPEENEEQVDGFLQRHPEFARDPWEGAVDASLVSPRGELVVLPQRQGVDGSFAARLRRSA